MEAQAANVLIQSLAMFKYLASEFSEAFTLAKGSNEATRSFQ